MKISEISIQDFNKKIKLFYFLLEMFYDVCLFKIDFYVFSLN